MKMIGEIGIIFEDENVLVLDKPSGVVVNRAESVEEQTIQDWVIENKLINESSDQVFLNRSGMVHRLDKETSGVMLWAKNEKSMYFLMKQFKERAVEKKYLALVHDRLVPDNGQISLPLGRIGRGEKFGVVLGGKVSRTSYQVVREYRDRSGNMYGLVELFPKTGRTHQLRVVLKHLNHPIVCDSKYVGKKRLKKDKTIIDRLFLHANKIGFNLPFGEEWVEFESDMRDELLKCLSNLSNVEM